MKYINAGVLYFCVATAAFSAEPMILGFEKAHFGDDINQIRQKYRLEKCLTKKDASYLQHNEISCSVSKKSLRKIMIGNTTPLSNLTLIFGPEKLLLIIANIDYVSENKYSDFTTGYNKNKSATVSVINWLHGQYGQPDAKHSKQWSSKGHIDRRLAPSEKTIEWRTSQGRVKAIYDGQHDNAGIAIYWSAQ